MPKTEIFEVEATTEIRKANVWITEIFLSAANFKLKIKIVYFLGKRNLMHRKYFHFICCGI